MPKHIAEREQAEARLRGLEGEHKYRITEAERAEERARLKNKRLIKFKDLKARGIVQSWAQLGHLIESHDFPTGFYLGSNTRVWNESNVDDWLVNRPTDRRVAKKEAATLKPKFRERYVTP
jgi:predicted DNA-binding transcriptional regulator AlpA